MSCVQDLPDDLSQVIANQATRDLHNSKGTIPWFSNMADTQDISVKRFKLLAQVVRWRRLEVRRKWSPIGDRS